MSNNTSQYTVQPNIYLRNGFQYDIHIYLHLKHRRVRMSPAVVSLNFSPSPNMLSTLIEQNLVRILFWSRKYCLITLSKSCALCIRTRASLSLLLNWLKMLLEYSLQVTRSISRTKALV